MTARTPIRGKSHPLRKINVFGQLLDPIDQLSEAIFSILILLSFTLAFRLFVPEPQAGTPSADEYVYNLLVAAFSATVAWGIIDGIMHVLVSVLQRGESYRFLRRIQAADTQEAGVAVVAEEFDWVLEPISDEGKRRALYKSVLGHLTSSRPQAIGVKLEDLAGALGCVLVAIVAVLPSLVPFAVLHSRPLAAIRVSNVVSFVMLFAYGYLWGQYTGSSPWKTGVSLFVAGAVMMLVVISLGG